MTKLRTSAADYEAPELIELLIGNLPVIQSIKLFSPPMIPAIQDGPSISVQEKMAISEALSIRKKLNLPFWDSLFLYLSDHSVTADNILRRATLHNSQDLESFTISRDRCTAPQMRDIIATLPAGRILAVSSKVLTEQGKTLHLPMLDFHCEESRENDILVMSVVREIGYGGYIVRSGRSYHFYGRDLIDEPSLIGFLGKSLLFCPIVDRAWIAHQLLERACGLRISPGKGYSKCPKVILEI